MSNIIYAADLFCGAGGTSTGLLHAAERLGKDVRLLAINHWNVAIETHRANHPSARHLTTGLEAVTPADVVPSRRLDLLWASPSCTHHSVARGGRPRCNQSRAQPHLILDWLDQLYVRRLMIENVPEFQNWGPLSAKGLPIKAKAGVLFDDYVRSLEVRGYKCEWKVLCCADYGDATTRERFFLQAVRGRGKIRWPEPTHFRNPGLFREYKPWVPARDIIDWSLHGTSIFRRKKPLADNTLRRIEAGIRKYWGEWAEPFLIVLRGTRSPESTTLRLDSPLPTLTAGGGHVAVVEPFLTTLAHGTPDGNFGRRVYGIDEPCRTLTAANEQAIIEPFIVPQHSCGAPRGMGQPIPTVTTDGAHALVEPFLTMMNNYPSQLAGYSLDRPLPTQTSANHMGLSSRFLFHSTAQAMRFPFTSQLPLLQRRIVSASSNSTASTSCSGCSSRTNSPAPILSPPTTFSTAPNPT